MKPATAKTSTVTVRNKTKSQSTRQKTLSQASPKKYKNWQELAAERRVRPVDNDIVNKPYYYNQGNIETIDFIEDKQLNFNKGNAVKYISRAGIKNRLYEIDDLEKAIWYINREIENIKFKQEFEIKNM